MHDGERKVTFLNYNLMFFVNSILLGVGLAMDAFSVSLANGLNEPLMKKNRMALIAGTFGIFQALMPMIGWGLVHTIAQMFDAFEKFIPWIALILLLYIGIKMILEGLNGNEEEDVVKNLSVGALIIQGVATSIDALSVGFTIADYDCLMALICALIIAIVTFIICIVGLLIGKRVGTKIAGRANILGGIILVFIGVEIFVKGMFF